jgi:hypothetical protein
VLTLFLDLEVVVVADSVAVVEIDSVEVAYPHPAMLSEQLNL